MYYMTGYGAEQEPLVEPDAARDASLGVILGVGLLVFLVGYVALADRAR
jgi:hypothetical protein